MFTMLTTKFEYRHINNKKLNNNFFNRKKPVLEVLELVNSKLQSL